MDQPVCVRWRTDTEHALTPCAAGQKPKEEQHQLPPVEDVPQDGRSPQAKLSGSHTGAHRTLYTICIPTARRDVRGASAHIGRVVLSAITTLGRRLGEVDTVVYMQFMKRWNFPHDIHIAVMVADNPPGHIARHWATSGLSARCALPFAVPSCATCERLVPGERFCMFLHLVSHYFQDAYTDALCLPPPTEQSDRP